MTHLRMLVPWLCGACLGCGPAPAPEAVATPPPDDPVVRVSSCEIPGVIGAARVARLEAPLSGRVRLAAGIAVGASVDAGALVATLQTREDAGERGVLEAAWRGARARADVQRADALAARRKHTELQALQGVESRSTLSDARDEVARAEARNREAKAGVAQAVAAREQAASRAEFASLRAPFAGTIVLLPVGDGERMQPGDDVALVRDDTKRRLRFAVDPDAAAELLVGHHVRYRRASDGGTGTATIRTIPASPDPRTGLLLLEAELPATEDAREGSSAHVSVPTHAAHWCTEAEPPPRRPA